MDIICVFTGGALGALLRYILLLGFKTYPTNVIGVLIVNMLGCFVIGLVSYLAVKRFHILNNNLKSFLIVGFAGGFTTFSAFTHPMLEMLFMHHYVYVFLNLFISVIAGLIFVAWGMNFGYYIMAYLIKTRKLYYKRNY